MASDFPQPNNPEKQPSTMHTPEENKPTPQPGLTTKPDGTSVRTLVDGSTIEQSKEGGQMITGKMGIEYFRLLSIRGVLQLAEKGLMFRHTSHTKKLVVQMLNDRGVKAGVRAKNLLALFEQHILEPHRVKSLGEETPNA
jgi:hypothetical protein